MDPSTHSRACACFGFCLLCLLGGEEEGGLVRPEGCEGQPGGVKGRRSSCDGRSDRDVGAQI
eukprot:1184659-Prorocentrum_minimum.AAC.2